MRTSNARRKQNIRKKAQRKLWSYTKGVPMECRWCGEPIIRLASIRRYNVIEVKRGMVTYREGGQILTKRQASVDHLQPIKEQGGNDIRNLVPSCVRCNTNRTATPSPKSDKERRTCPDCGGRKQKGRTRCPACHRKITEAYFESLKVTAALKPLNQGCAGRESA